MGAKDIKLSYGLRDGHIVLISEIDKNERGEKCKCTCPKCGEVLIARLGEVKRPHFAHKSLCNCDDKNAQESGLHTLAKEIIKDNSSIFVPGFEITRAEITPKDINPYFAAMVKLGSLKMSGCNVTYNSVEIEKPIDNIVADAVIRVKEKEIEKECIVEVAVTHFVDEIKRQKLKEIGRSAFEIDLSDLLMSLPTREMVEAAVLSDKENRYWVFNPLKEQKIREKKAELREKYDEEKRKEKQAEKRKKEYRDNNIIALQELMNPDNYARELNQLRDDKRAVGCLNWLDFSKGKGLKEYPFYMDIPITGECVFTCDRRIWQGVLFNDYVYKGFNQDICFFNVKAIQDRFYSGKSMIKYDPKRTYRASLVINGKEQEVSFSYDVIRRYFEYLNLLGFISGSGYKWNSERPVSLDPPNTQTASILAYILKEVLKPEDYSSPNINQIIKDELINLLNEPEKSIVLGWDKRY